MLKIINKYNSITLSLILFSCTKIFSAAVITSAENNNSDILGDKLVTAAKYGNKEVVEELIKAGANLNATDSNKSTPLMWAASKGNEEIVTLLIEAGADTEIVNIEPGTTALFYGIISFEPKKIVPLLLCAGSDVNKKDKYGNSFKSSIEHFYNYDPANAELIKYLKELLEQEPTRRETVTNKWSSIYAEQINKLSGSLILPILKIITSYSTEYNDIPIEFRLENIDIIKNN